MRWMVAVGLLSLSMALTLGQEAGDDSHTELKFAEATLQKAGLKTDDAALLTFFRERTLSGEKHQQLALLVSKLGDRSYKARAQATHKIVEAGSLALPFLKEGLTSEDPEIVRRSEICLQYLLENSDAPLVLAAVRLLAQHRPAGAAKALLQYLPFAPNSEVVEQICQSLPLVSLDNGKPYPAVVAALQDKFPVRRAAAGEALARAPGQRAAVMPLLSDPQPDVRFQVALALVRAEEARAVPVLIALLDQVSEEKSWQAQEVLCLLAGDSTPTDALGQVHTAGQFKAVWYRWWQDNAQTIPAQLARLAKGPSPLGYTLVTQMGLQGGTNGQVMEISPKGKVRWKIEGLRYPLDAQVVGPNRVLIVEYLNRQVTERDFEGKVIWKQPVPLPIGCQRLVNGHTFVASRRELLVLDRDGKVVFTHHPNVSISAARMMRDGTMVMITIAGQCIRLDPQGKQLNSFQAGPVYTMGGNIDVLANGRILVPEYRLNKVVEYTPEGKIFWQATIRWPTSAVRLTNGHTLVVCMMDQRIVELNRAGQVVWEFRTSGRPWRAVRR